MNSYFFVGIFKTERVFSWHIRAIIGLYIHGYTLLIIRNIQRQIRIPSASEKIVFSFCQINIHGTGFKFSANFIGFCDCIIQVIEWMLYCAISIRIHGIVRPDIQFS
ncbi:hypothetical protein FGO68_gene588 [Halteria grandinella]|uniref:Uncharacterized protein n=1 Tax=Halteria grandinella TaxID=5974 RepID=A0A8J8P955_HALGN|nr:hypothetical protein FGO68_gene588 [Halteria grandinella]